MQVPKDQTVKFKYLNVKTSHTLKIVALRELMRSNRRDRGGIKP
jgi:hypothetical protein